MNVETRTARIEAQVIESAERDWDAVIDWMAQWSLDNLDEETIERIRLEGFVDSDEAHYEQMVSAMPADLQRRADRAWLVIHQVNVNVNVNR